MIRNIRESKSGFTIIEVIIVLTITTALLASALALFRDKIPRTQFSSAVNELSVKLDDTLSQVSNGYYPSSQNLVCTRGDTELTSSGTDAEPGVNEECIFIGQAVQFGRQNSSSGGTCSQAGPDDKCDTIVFYTIFGDRVSASGHIAKSLTDSSPRVSATLAQQLYTTSYGLFIKKIIARGETSGGIGYLQSFGSGVNTDGDIDGASQVELLPLLGTDIGMEQSVFKTTLDGLGSGTNRGFYSPRADNDGIKLCLQSATTDQVAIITLGINGAVSQNDKQIFEDDTAFGWTGAGC